MTLLEISRLTIDLAGGTRLLRRHLALGRRGRDRRARRRVGSGKSLTARSVLGFCPDGARPPDPSGCDGHEVLGAPVGELLAHPSHERRRWSSRTRAPASTRCARSATTDRIAAPLRGLVEPRARRACPRTARGGAPAAARGPPPPVPARALGRHAAARHDRRRPHELAASCWSATSRRRRSTSRPRPRSSRCSASSARSRGMGMLFITHDLNLAAPSATAST